MTQQIDSLNAHSRLYEGGERVFSSRNLPTWAQVSGKPTNLATTGTNQSVSFATIQSINTGGVLNHSFENATSVATYRTDNPGGWRLWMPGVTGGTALYISGANGVVNAVRGLQVGGHNVFHDGRVPTAAQVGAKPASYVPSWAEITGKPASATRNPTWNEITGKPSTFTPPSHTHTWSQITGEPVYTTRWPTWNEVTGKPTLVTISSGDARYLGKTAKAADSDKLDGLNSTDFYRRNNDIVVTKNTPRLVLDSSSSGSNTGPQAATVSLGESGTGGAALHLAYTGDGRGYIGMGSLGSDNIPDNWVMRLGYTSTNVYFRATGNSITDIWSRAQQGITQATGDGRYLRTTGKAADANLLDGIDSGGFLRRNSFTNTTQSLHFVTNYGVGICGEYSPTRFQNVFAMDQDYRMKVDGTGLTGGPGSRNFYGIGWTHSNNTDANARKITGHHAIFCTNGVTKSAIGDHIWTAGNCHANGTMSDGSGTVYTSGRRPSASNVGLGNLHNWTTSTSYNDSSTSKYARAKDVYDAATAPRLDGTRKRKITISTAAPSGGSSGDVWIKY